MESVLTIKAILQEIRDFSQLPAEINKKSCVIENRENGKSEVSPCRCTSFPSLYPCERTLITSGSTRLADFGAILGVGNGEKIELLFSESSSGDLRFLPRGRMGASCNGDKRRLLFGENHVGVSSRD